MLNLTVNHKICFNFFILKHLVEMQTSTTFSGIVKSQKPMLNDTG